MNLIDTRPDVAASLAGAARRTRGRRASPRSSGSSRHARSTTSGTSLPSVTAPTLVAAGRYDGIAPLANGEAIAARIPGARLEVFDGGHAFMYQDPRAWPTVLEFLT